MPDLRAGSKVKGLDTPPTVSDFEAGSFTFTNTTYGISTTGGTYADCGVAFVAPTTGRVVLHYDAAMLNSSTGVVAVAPVVRTGATVGSGAVVVAGADDNNIASQGTNSRRCGAHLLVEGLTPGDTYNVRLEHRVTANTGTALRRRVTVAPST